MDLWSIIDTILDWVFNWRFNLCFYGSLVLAAAAASSIQHKTLSGITAAGIFVAGWVVGIRWDSSS